MFTIGSRTSIDLWRLALERGAATTQLLCIGQSTQQTVADVFGWRVERLEAALVEAALPGYREAHVKSTFVQFDPEGRLSGFGYDPRLSDQATETVRTAVAKRDSLGSPLSRVELPLSERVTLRFCNQSLDAFATLPRFINAAQELGPVHIKAYPDDKEIQIERATTDCMVFARFGLEAFKARSVGAFEVDYLLRALYLITTASLAAIADGAAPTPHSNISSRERP